MLALQTPHLDKLSLGGDSEDEGSGNEDSDDDYDEDEDECDDSVYRAALGTRPEFPDHLTEYLDESYKTVLSIFYACTEEDPDKRPSAKMIIDLL